MSLTKFQWTSGRAFFCFVMFIIFVLGLSMTHARAAPIVSVVMTQGAKTQTFYNNSVIGSNNYMAYETNFVAGEYATRAPTTIFLALPGTPQLPNPDPGISGGFCVPSNFGGNDLDGCTYGFTIRESATRIDPGTLRGFLDFWFVGPGFVESVDFNAFRTNSIYPFGCAGCVSYLNQVYPDTMASGAQDITPFLRHPLFSSRPGVDVSFVDVPEPASIFTFGFAIAVLGSLRRRLDPS